LLELRNTHREFSRLNRPNLFYPFFVNESTGTVSLAPANGFETEVYPLWPDGFEGCWTWGKELAGKDTHLLLAQKIRGTWKVFRKSYAASEEGENVKKKLFTIWQDPRFFTEKGQVAFGEIFPGLNKNDFPQPKSVDLLTEIFKTCTKSGDIILDSFGGSGTSGQALLNLNREDDGKRKFILIEMMDYADSITSERIKRVIRGYEGAANITGAFDFYELGSPLFLASGKLNVAVGEEKIRQYIYYTETKTSMGRELYKDNKYFLGKEQDTCYYFHYEPGKITTLDHDFLATMKTKAGQYVIYADNCLLTPDFLTRRHIIFKKIPRDITRF
jgi:adenine-specific DNA-methyltransferase